MVLHGGSEPFSAPVAGLSRGVQSAVGRKARNYAITAWKQKLDFAIAAAATGFPKQRGGGAAC